MEENNRTKWLLRSHACLFEFKYIIVHFRDVISFNRHTSAEQRAAMSEPRGARSHAPTCTERQWSAHYNTHTHAQGDRVFILYAGNYSPTMLSHSTYLFASIPTLWIYELSPLEMITLKANTWVDKEKHTDCDFSFRYLNWSVTVGISASCGHRCLVRKRARERRKHGGDGRNDRGKEKGTHVKVHRGKNISR